MSAEIIFWQGATKLDLPAERVLQRAIDADLDGVVIVGYGKDGQEYFASTWADAAQASWHLQRGIFKLNEMVDRVAEEGLSS